MRVSYTTASSSYSISTGSAAAFQKRGGKGFLLIILLVAAGIAAGIWFYFNPTSYDITLNGEKVHVEADATLQQLVDKGLATPKPGNLLAIDGSIAEYGAGTLFSASINDESVDTLGAQVSRDAIVTITDGQDIEEEYTEETLRIPFGTSSMLASEGSYHEGSIHIYSMGVDGIKSIKTGKVSGITDETVIKNPINKGYTVYTPDVGNDKVIAFTFDDGPWPDTSRQILDILNENDAHATFFVVGEQCSYNSQVLKDISAAGNQIASHTYDHANGSGLGVDLSLMSPQEQIDEVNKGFKAIEDVMDVDVTRVLRAPGGNYEGALVETLAPYISAEIGWNIDTRDWEMPGAQAIVDQMLKVEPGQVILMHDGGGNRTQTVEALRIALPLLKELGYSFITIDELLEYGVRSSEYETI